MVGLGTTTGSYRGWLNAGTEPSLLNCRRRTTTPGLLSMPTALSTRLHPGRLSWWGNTGQEEAARRKAVDDGRDPDAPFDPWVTFFHDADAELLAEAQALPPPLQSDRPFDDPWPLDAWPDVPTRFIAAEEDRLFPLEFQRRVVGERLGVDVETVPGGHLAALTQPSAVAARLLA